MHSINSLLKYPRAGRTYKRKPGYESVEATILYVREEMIYCKLMCGTEYDMHNSYTLEQFNQYFEPLPLP